MRLGGLCLESGAETLLQALRSRQAGNQAQGFIKLCLIGSAGRVAGWGIHRKLLV